MKSTTNLPSEKMNESTRCSHARGGGSHIDMVYVYVPAFWDAILQNLV